jgi:predicted regulator of Ras-like GTPase activity (Roadblock/LC7/MglB family)
MTINSSKIPRYVQAFFESCEIDEKINRFSFFMIRADGVVLYHNNNLADSLSKSSIGALLSGVWQASKALSQFIPKEEMKEGYRLSFDTSSQGIYIVPISTDADELYLGLIYHDEVNPGFIKNKMREMASSFSEFLNQELRAHKKEQESKNNVFDKNEYLFGDISDAEMDRLFSFIKN